MSIEAKAEELIARANIRYVALKSKRLGIDFSYTAPEALPTIGSDQVKALAFVIAQELEALQAGKETNK